MFEFLRAFKYLTVEMTADYILVNTLILIRTFKYQANHKCNKSSYLYIKMLMLRVNGLQYYKIFILKCIFLKTNRSIVKSTVNFCFNFPIEKPEIQQLNKYTGMDSFISRTIIR